MLRGAASFSLQSSRPEPDPQIFKNDRFDKRDEKDDPEYYAGSIITMMPPLMLELAWKRAKADLLS